MRLPRPDLQNPASSACLPPVCRAVLTGVVSGLVACTSAAAAQPVQYEVQASIAAPNALWDYATVDAVHRRLYVARADGVLAVDLTTGKVTPVLVKSTGAHVAMPLPGADLAAAANTEDNTVSLFEGDTGRVRAVIPAGEGPDSIAFEPVTGLIAVTDQDGGAVSLIDPRTRTVKAKVALGGAPEAIVADGRGRLFDNIEDRNEIAVIDPVAKAVVARYPLPRCQEPTGLAYDPGSDLLVSACRNGVTNLVNASTGKVEATLDLEPGPDTVMVDPRRQLAFVPSGRGVLTIVDLSPGRVGTVNQRLATQPGCRTGAVDPQTGLVYLPAAQLLPSTDPKKHVLVPGTFRILVIGPAAPPAS